MSSAKIPTVRPTPAPDPAGGADSLIGADSLAGADPPAVAAAEYQLVAIDLDGTLLSPTGEVTPRTRRAIHALLAKGMLVCFATGRNWTESRAVLEDVAHFSTAVFVGGAMVIDTDKKVTLYRTCMDPVLAGEVCAYLESHGHAVLALQDTDAAGVDYLASEGAVLNDATACWMRLTRAQVHRAGRLGEHPHPHTVRVGICADVAEVDRVVEELRSRFGDRILCQGIHVPGSGVQVLEVFDPAVNKWQGLLHVAKRHGIDPMRIIAIGDDINDLPMIRHAGLGVAMGNARLEIRAVADVVIGPNSAEGLAEFLESLAAQTVAVESGVPAVPGVGATSGVAAASGDATSTDVAAGASALHRQNFSAA